MRIRFSNGKQRKFIKEILQKLMCPSLRSLRQRGVKYSYSCLKNYYNESRTMPKELFDDLCTLTAINKKKIKFKELDENWGKVKGGKA